MYGFNEIVIHIHCQSHFCTGIYCPVSKGKVVPGVTATGCEELWRLLYSDYSSTQEQVKAKLEEESWHLQPQNEDFFLLEFTTGT